MPQRRAADRNPMAQLTVQVMQEAKGRTGKASVLIARMEPEVRRRYAEDSVSAWIRGQVVPPADAFLAAAKVTGISIDEYLQSEEQLERTADRLSRQAEEIEDLRERVERLTEVLAVVPELQETVRTLGEAVRVMRKQVTKERQPEGS